MKDETPNERNFRLLRERFLKEDRIVYSDDNGNEYSFLEMKDMFNHNAYIKNGRCHYTGIDAMLRLLESPSNNLRNEVADVISDLERERNGNNIEWGYYKNEIVCPVTNENGIVIGFKNENETKNGNENENELGNENGLIDMLHYSYNQIKKLL